LTPEDKWVSPRTDASLEVLEVPGEDGSGVLRVRRVLKPDARASRRHVHLDFAEHFTVEAGVARARLGDLRLWLSAENPVLHVPPGVMHVNPHSADIGDLTLVQCFEPGRGGSLEGALAYVRTLGEVLRDGRDEGGELPLSLVLAVFDATDAGTYVGPLWFPLQTRVLRPLGSALAGARGYAVWLTR
jgi:hypothetical protein